MHKRRVPPVWRSTAQVFAVTVNRNSRLRRHQNRTYLRRHRLVNNGLPVGGQLLPIFKIKVLGQSPIWKVKIKPCRLRLPIADQKEDQHAR